LITSIWLIGGLQLIGLGLVGEYIGKIYKETKRRPKYNVDVDLVNLGIPNSYEETHPTFNTIKKKAGLNQERGVSCR